MLHFYVGLLESPPNHRCQIVGYKSVSSLVALSVVLQTFPGLTWNSWKGHTKLGASQNYQGLTTSATIQVTSGLSSQHISNMTVTLLGCSDMEHLNSIVISISRRSKDSVHPACFPKHIGWMLSSLLLDMEWALLLVLNVQYISNCCMSEMLHSYCSNKLSACGDLSFTVLLKKSYIRNVKVSKCKAFPKIKHKTQRAKPQVSLQGSHILFLLILQLILQPVPLPPY